MARLLNTTQFAVNTIHHQAIKTPGEGVNVVGRAEDGTVEAIEVEGYRFIMGLQCHPEEIYTQVPACATLFQAFISACNAACPYPPPIPENDTSYDALVLENNSACLTQ